MSVEVKQLIIKSTVVTGSAEQQRPETAAVDIEQLKEIVMEECKEFIIDSLNDMQER